MILTFEASVVSLTIFIENPIILVPSRQRYSQPIDKMINGLGYVGDIMGFGYSFSSNVRDMDGNQTPDFAIGAVSTKGEPIASLLLSKPTVYIKPMSKPSANQPNVIDPENLGNFIDLQGLLLLDFHFSYPPW